MGNEKKMEEVGIDFASGLLGIGVGKLVPAKRLVSSAVSDKWVKNGIKGPLNFTFGIITTDLSGGLVGSFLEGGSIGLSKKMISQFQQGGKHNRIMLPQVTISEKRGEITSEGKITNNGIKKIEDHLRINIDKIN